MAPRIGIEVLECRADSEPGRWLVRWRVLNDGSAPIALHTAWIPHGRFRGDGRLPLSGVLEPRAATILELFVRAQEQAGARVDNAYLILQVSTDGQAWRIFTRMRVEFDTQAVPQPIVEAITTAPAAAER
jgi:hypothetical protein